MSARIILVIVMLFLFGGLFLWQRTASERPVSQGEAIPVVTPTASDTPAPEGHVSASSQSQAPTSVVDREKALAEFKRKFGEDLQVKLTKDGYLASVEGSVTGSARAGAGFDPKDPRKAVARAQEILAAAASLLGVQPEFPLQSPFAQTGATSAQVFYRESVGGMPISPYGRVSIDLGPRGELIGLHSSYVRNISVENQRKLDSGAAREYAVAAVKDPGTALRTEGGDSTVWIVSPPQPGAGQSVIARHAFEFNVKGWQVVVDAQDGRVIYKRDVRIR